MVVGNVVGTKALSVTERAVFDAIQANPIATAKEIATAIGKSERQVERARASLRDAGLIERIGGTRRALEGEAIARTTWIGSPAMPFRALRCERILLSSFAATLPFRVTCLRM